METIMNGNCEAIKQKYPVLWERYQEKLKIENKEENISTYIDTAVDGTDIVTFNIDGIYRYVNSRYAPAKEAEIWAEKYGNYHPNGLLIIFGLGNGIHIRALLKRLGAKNPVFIVEPSVSMFQMIMKEFDISDILCDDRVILEVKGISDGVLDEALSLIVNYSNYKLVDIYSLPNYDKIYGKDYDELFTRYKSVAELVVLDRNTHIKYSGEFIRNILENYNDIIHQYTINGLKEVFKDVDTENIPAVIVSAGPSLDKNIQELEKAQGKCFLIVVDTALKPVLNAGIMPDISVIVDPHKPLKLFQHEEIKNIPMVAGHKANYKVLQNQTAPRFYFGEPNQYISYIYQKYAGLTVDGLDTGGSVANNAFSLARYLGFKTIILVGQDLAFEGNKSHVSNAYSDKMNRERLLKNSEACMVEGINGTMVETMKNMETYLRWFERQFRIHNELKVIDATEGGAKKKGTEILTLREAIERECKTEFHCGALIQKVPKAFTEEQIAKIQEEFRDIPNQIRTFVKQMEQGIRDYYRFEELYRKGKCATAEFKKITDKITNINQTIDECPLYELISTYNSEDNFALFEEAYTYKENEQDEIKDIVHKGIKMLNSYKEAANKLQADIPILLNSIE